MHRTASRLYPTTVSATSVLKLHILLQECHLARLINTPHVEMEASLNMGCKVYDAEGLPMFSACYLKF